MPQTRSSGDSTSLSEDGADAIAASAKTTKRKGKNKREKSPIPAKSRKGNNPELQNKSTTDSELEIDNDVLELPSTSGCQGEDQTQVCKQTQQLSNLANKDQSMIPHNSDGQPISDCNNVGLQKNAVSDLDEQQIQRIVTSGMPALLKAMREDPEARKILTEGLRIGEQSGGGTTSRVVLMQGGQPINQTTQNTAGNMSQTSPGLVNTDSQVIASTSVNESDTSELLVFQRCLSREAQPDSAGADISLTAEDMSNPLNSSDETDKQLVMDRFVMSDNSQISDMSHRPVVDAGRPVARTSNEGDQRDKVQQAQQRSRQRARDTAREAENAQVQLLHPPGELAVVDPELINQQLSQLRMQSATAQPKRSVTFSSQVAVAGDSEAGNLSDCDSDDDYHIYAHVDEKVVQTIQNGEFIELNKVAPTGIVDDDDDKLQLVNAEGKIGVVQGSRALPQINNYQQWQAAFRVFSAIYQKAFPTKGIELLEYEHNIQNAARHYIWSNVAKYDRMFRKRMAKYHFRRNPKSWADKYSKAWDFELQEKLAKPYLLFNTKQSGGNNPQPSTSAASSGNAKKDICLFFNKTGKCRYGNKCHRDHRCLHCGKQGHAMINCHKLKNKDNDK